MPDALPEGTLFVLEPILGPPLKSIPFAAGDTKTVGRAPECQVQLPETEKTVSRKHCRIDARDNAWSLCDLSSRFGTTVNEQPATPGASVTFRDGDRIRIGPWTFRVCAAANASLERTSHDDTISTDTSIIHLPKPSTEPFDRKKLEALWRVGKRLLPARDEVAVAEPSLDALVECSGYPRAALIRLADANAEKIDVLGLKAAPGRDVQLPFSRSLLQAVISAKPVDGPVTPVAANTADRGQALALPLGSAQPNLVLYLDRRPTEPPVGPESIGFAQAVAEMALSAIANARRARAEAERRAANEQIESAMSLQVQLLPNPRGRVGRVQYAMQVKPSKAVGGDTFDILALDHRRVAFCISDVSGRGLPAAILAATTQSYIAALLRTLTDPAAVLDATNTHLVKHAPDDKFVSLWLGILDTHTGLLRYCDAGHSYWLLRSPSGQVEKVREGQSGGPPLRVTEGLRYHASEMVLKPKARVILYSDGLLEQTGRDRKAFGVDHLIEAVRAANGPDEDLQSIFREAAKLGAADAVTDDLTVASVEYLPDGP